MRSLPSMQALSALESFSRHGSVRAAADELCLTRSAVSHQLRLLERELGFSLFSKVGTRIELTARGREYSNDVSSALSAIGESAARNAGRELSGQLTVSCTPGLAANWLSLKIGRFRKQYPDISLSIVIPRKLDDTSDPNSDVFLAFGDGNMEGMNVELLKEVEFTPLVSPVLLNRMSGLSHPKDVLRCELLHLSDHEDWCAWLQEAGICKKTVNLAGTVFADMNLVCAAAISAQGIAMGDELICHEAMETGHLIRPFELAIKSPKSYYLAIPPTKTGFASVMAFRQWVFDELTG